MELSIDNLLLAAALAGSGVYTAYMVKKQRDDIRKTIQIIDLGDAEFWQGLTELRDLAPARA